MKNIGMDIQDLSVVSIQFYVSDYASLLGVVGTYFFKRAFFQKTRKRLGIEQTQ